MEAHDFWKRVDIGEKDECWEWQGYIRPDGYGRLNWSEDPNERKRAHRVAYLIAYGEIDDDMVLHHCDNRSCVNPNHLYAGDHDDNVQDAIDRDRYTPFHPVDRDGENNPAAKLTDEEVVEIRDRYENSYCDSTQYELADEFGVTQPLINKIVNYKTRTMAFEV